jgi:hypothetical protein
MSDDRDVYSAANGFTDARQAITRALTPVRHPTSAPAPSGEGILRRSVAATSI